VRSQRVRGRNSRGGVGKAKPVVPPTHTFIYILIAVGLPFPCWAAVSVFHFTYFFPFDEEREREKSPEPVKYRAVTTPSATPGLPLVPCHDYHHYRAMITTGIMPPGHHNILVFQPYECLFCFPFLGFRSPPYAPAFFSVFAFLLEE